MRSLRALATVKRTTVLAGILMASPVAGLRPIRALRLTTLNLPRPFIGTSPPFLIVFSTTVVSPSRNIFALLRSEPAASDRAWINSVFVIETSSKGEKTRTAVCTFARKNQYKNDLHRAATAAATSDGDPDEASTCTSASAYAARRRSKNARRSSTPEVARSGRLDASP